MRMRSLAKYFPADEPLFFPRAVVFFKLLALFIKTALSYAFKAVLMKHKQKHVCTPRCSSLAMTERGLSGGVRRPRIICSFSLVAIMGTNEGKINKRTERGRARTEVQGIANPFSFVRLVDMIIRWISRFRCTRTSARPSFW